MSGLNKIPYLFLLALICIAGCKKSKTVITLNSDGSGTVVLNVDFDRATDEQRKKFREQLKSENFSCGYEEDRFRPLFPEPHFTIKKYKFDTKKLTVYAKINFTDINRLLVKKNADKLDLKGFDFSIDDSKIAFTVKTDGDGGIEAMMRKGSESLPVIREIVIISGKTKKNVRFYEEKGPDTPPADWSGSLDMKGHTIERNIIKHNFAGYPLIKLEGEIREAEWSLHKTASSDFSNLDVTVEPAIPQSKGITYIKWSEPVLLSGQYVPEQKTELTNNCRNMSRKFVNNFSPKPKVNHFLLPLEFNFPALQASAITDSVVRLKALRAMGSKQYKLGRIEPEKKYEAGGMSFKSKKTKRDNRLDFAIKGNVDSVKSIIFRTKRGSRFTLKERSRSSRASGGSIEAETFIPPNEGAVYVELYDPIDYVWLDIAVREIDFENPPDEADFAGKVVKDKSLHQSARKKALDEIFRRGNVEDLSLVRQFIEDPQTRWSAVQALLNLVNSIGRNNTVDVMKQRFKPLIPILQDLAEYPNSQQKYAVKILDKLGNPPNETYEQDMIESIRKSSYSFVLAIIALAVLAAGAACLILSRRKHAGY